MNKRLFDFGDCDVIAKLDEAKRKNIEEVDFIDEDGKRIRILLPGRVDSDFLETS